jgi:hypothetical protein
MTTPVSVIPSPLTVACAPIGIWHPPPSASTTARSAWSVQRLVVANPLDGRGGGRVPPGGFPRRQSPAGRGHAPVEGHQRGNPRRLIEAAQAGRGQQ